MATNPAYAATPRVGVTTISTANTNRDGTGTIGTVLTAGASGSRVDRVVVTATGTVTAGMVRMFLHDGATAKLYCEVSVLATTPSASVKAFIDTLEAVTTPDLFPLILPNGWSLRASTHNAESFNVTAIGGDL